MTHVYRWAPKHHRGGFYDTPEDQMDTVAKYYAIPSVSFRNTFFQFMQSSERLKVGQILHFRKVVLGLGHFKKSQAAHTKSYIS